MPSSTVIFSINSMLMLDQVLPVRGLQSLLPLMSTKFPYRAQLSFSSTRPSVLYVGWGCLLYSWHYGKEPIRVLNGLSSVYFSKTATWIIDGCADLFLDLASINPSGATFLPRFHFSLRVNRLTVSLCHSAQKFVILISAECENSCSECSPPKKKLKNTAPLSLVGRWPRSLSGLSRTTRHAWTKSNE